MVRIGIIIPAYNESESIIQLVDRINQLKLNECEINYVVINDASTDQTLETLQKNKINHLNLSINLGIGGAVQTGFQWAFKNQFDYAVQMDGDGQHPPEELIKLIDAIILNGSDLIIGSRFIDKQGFQSSFFRRLGIRCISIILQLFIHQKISDPTSGYRIFNKKAINLSFKVYPDEYPEPESLVYFKLNGLKISEIPVMMNERVSGKSSISGLNSIYYMFKVSIAMFFTYFRYRK